MKTNNTPEQIKNIIAALQKIHVRTFDEKSSNPKYNAQRNLDGITHYVDDGTLSFHKSRIVSTRVLHGGLLFRVTCSDALDMHNTKRGFRSAVFDCFGTCVSRPKLEEAYKTSNKAIDASNAEEIDLVAHYAEAFDSQIKNAQEKTQDLYSAAALIG